MLDFIWTFFVCLFWALLASILNPLNTVDDARAEQARKRGEWL